MATRLGDRCHVELVDDRTVFAKRAIDQATADSLRAERRIYDAVIAPFLPRFLGWEDGRLPLLVLDDLSGAKWPPPWSEELVDAVLETLVRVAAPRRRAGCADWDEALPVLLAASPDRLLDGATLLHFDVRSDNLCIRDAGLPPPPGAPSVRGCQLAQLEVALPWAIRALGLPRREAPP